MLVDKERFASVNEFLSAINEREVNEGWRGHGRSSRDVEDEAEPWSGARDWEDALGKAYRGYAEVVDKVKVAVNQSAKAVMKRVEPRPVRPVNKVVGGSPNVARAMMGLPRDMRAMERNPRKRPGVTLIYEAGANWSWSHDEIINAGAHMLALLKLFERDQIPVRLVLSITSEMTGGWKSLEITVKEFSDGLNIQKVAHYLAHPSTLRRLNFSWKETSPIIRRYDSGYGWPLSNSKDRCRRYAKQVEEETGAYWFCLHDMVSDDDVVKAYERIVGDR